MLASNEQSEPCPSEMVPAKNKKLRLYSPCFVKDLRKGDDLKCVSGKNEKNVFPNQQKYEEGKKKDNGRTSETGAAIK